MRRKLAVPMLLVSLLGAIGTFLPFAIVPAVRELATEGDAIAAIIVVAPANRQNSTRPSWCCSRLCTQ